jgi:hypothetical protein
MKVNRRASPHLAFCRERNRNSTVKSAAASALVRAALKWHFSHLARAANFVLSQRCVSRRLIDMQTLSVSRSDAFKNSRPRALLKSGQSSNRGRALSHLHTIAKVWERNKPISMR